VRYAFPTREALASVPSENSQKCALHRGCALHRVRLRPEDYCSNPWVTHLLLQYGANVNCQQVDGPPPLHLAARFNSNSEVIHILLNEGANVNLKRNDGTSPLHWAAHHNPNIMTINLSFLHLFFYCRPKPVTKRSHRDWRMFGAGLDIEK
jgi:Ankyrin repeats (3 copies)